MNDETYQNFNRQDIKEHNGKGWMRRMSDILPVSLQDFMYSRQSDL